MPETSKSLIVELQVMSVREDTLETAMFGERVVSIAPATNIIGLGHRDQEGLRFCGIGLVELVEDALSKAGFVPEEISNLYLWLRDQSGTILVRLNAGSYRPLKTE